MKNYVRMTDRDNVVTMLRHLDPGEIINVDGVKIKATHDVPAYHKIAIAEIKAADHQNVFISGILRLLWTARHCDPLCLRHGDVLEKVLVHVGSDIYRRTP